MRYWEACDAHVTATEAIEECRIHQVKAAIRDEDNALIDLNTGEVIAHEDDDAYHGADILGYLGY